MAFETTHRARVRTLKAGSNFPQHESCSFPCNFPESPTAKIVRTEWTPISQALADHIQEKRVVDGNEESPLFFEVEPLTPAPSPQAKSKSKAKLDGQTSRSPGFAPLPHV